MLENLNSDQERIARHNRRMARASNAPRVNASNNNIVSFPEKIASNHSNFSDQKTPEKKRITKFFGNLVVLWLLSVACLVGGSIVQAFKDENTFLAILSAVVAIGVAFICLQNNNSVDK